MAPLRAALIWFAAGAATSGVVAASTAGLTSKPALQEPYLRVTEPLPRIPEKEYADVASLSGQMLHDCGAKAFDVTAWGIDIQSYAYLPLTPENSAALPCVVKRSAEEGFEIELVFQPGKES